MGKNIQGLRWIWAFVLLFPLLSACGKSGAPVADPSSIKPVQGTFFIFDTIVTVRIYGENATEEHLEAIEELLHSIDAKMSRTRADSEISQVNQAAGQQAVAVSKETFQVVQAALEYSKQTNGVFDLTIGPLVNLWQIGNENARVPKQEEINEALKLINYKHVELNEQEHTIRLTQPGMIIDLGAIAKGYAADEIAAYLLTEGMNSAMIDLGGNIYALGSKPGDLPWTIGIQDPSQDRGKPIGSLKVRNKTMVSSGIYERYFFENDIRYHHILDTHLGYPVNNGLTSVTIITNHSLDADALSTTAFAMGLSKGLAFVEAIPDTEAVFLTGDKLLYTTSGLKDGLNITSTEYKRAQ